MAENENDDLDLSPQNENSSSVSEYNPYEQFVQDNHDSVDSEELTTEKDISLPDFLNGINPSGGHGNEYDADADNIHNSVNETENKSDSSELNSESDVAAKDNEKNDEDSDNSDKNQNDDEEKHDSENKDDNNLKNNTFEENEELRFKPKISAEDANRKGGKPKVLNKKFILTVAIVVIGGIFLIAFLMPTGGKKKNDEKKPVASSYVSKDYESIARKHSLPADSNNHDENKTVENKGLYENQDEVVIPPVIPESNTKKAYESHNIRTNTDNSAVTSSSVEIPDTRNDSLQGKRISGIKGLSSTQESYSTDYQMTIAKNTSQTSSLASYSLPSKEEYMNNVLNAYSQAYGNATASNNAYAAQNDQSGKNNFFKDGRQGDNVGQGEWLNLNTLWQGSIFEAVLTSELNTDLPGEITARISKNIYSSQDGRYLLIPQNSIIYGTYNSSISYSQSRVQVAWHTLIRPDGYQIQLGNMNATDAKGASGLKGFVNDHPMAYLKAIGLMSVFSIVNSEFQSSMKNTQNEYVQNVLANSQEVTNTLGEKLVDRAMNVQPTIKVKAGTKINIVVNQNLSLPPVDNIPVTQSYHRLR